ncbi:MAG: metallophosphoesterase [Candidatus Zixiibacteriota bacterium]|nr:MAG: metallophosphoesterase [candidate division Zixibacteria bacterium]
MRRLRFIHIGLAAAIISCSNLGLLSERYPEDFYRVPKLMPDETLDKNPTFIVYSDNQAGFRINDKFLARKNWATWKMLIIPFYQLYLFGNGVAGAVNWYRHVPDLSGPEQRMVRDAIYGSALKNHIDFILNTGDISAHDGRRPDHWASFLKINKHESNLLNEIPYLPAIGNHDRANDSTYGVPNYQAVFQYPRFYVIDFPDGAIFVLDTNILLDQKGEIDDEYQNQLFRKWFVSSPGDGPSWLEKELSSRDVPFKIIAMHHPPISFNSHHRDWENDNFGKDLLTKRQKLLELFDRYDVKLVFSGHDHIYQHNVLFFKDKNSAKIDTVHFVVGGGGGTPLREESGSREIKTIVNRYARLGYGVEQLVQKKSYHYSLVSVSSEKLTVAVYKISDADGYEETIIDRYDITRRE